MKIIDSYHRSVIAPVKEKTASLYHEYQELQKKLSEQNMGEEQRIREMEFLKYEIQEIEEAQLRPGEDESLETEYQKVSHAKEILSDCAAVHEVTAGQTVVRVISLVRPYNGFIRCLILMPRLGD